MFIYLISIVTSIVAMNVIGLDKFSILLGVIVGSFFYMAYLLEDLYDIHALDMIARNGLAKKEEDED